MKFDIELVQTLIDYILILKQVDADSIRVPGTSTNLNVSELFDPWIRQYGYPLVTVNRTSTPVRQAMFEQGHFHLPGDQEVTTPSPWK